MQRWMLTSLLASLGFLTQVQTAHSEVFKSVKDCTPGKRVVDGTNHHRKITRNDNATMCFVAIDGGKEEARIFWMLHNEGESAETDDKLVPGKYECFAGGHYTFMDMYITGANTYEAAGKPGKFHVEPSRQIIFETGTLTRYHAKLLQGPRIGLNTDGGSFYATTCELKKK